MRFQPEEGRSRVLLCDCETSNFAKVCLQLYVAAIQPQSARVSGTMRAHLLPTGCCLLLLAATTQARPFSDNCSHKFVAFSIQIFKCECFRASPPGGGAADTSPRTASRSCARTACSTSSSGSRPRTAPRLSSATPPGRSRQCCNGVHIQNAQNQKRSPGLR